MSGEEIKSVGLEGVFKRDETEKDVIIVDDFPSNIHLISLDRLRAEVEDGKTCYAVVLDDENKVTYFYRVAQDRPRERTRAAAQDAQRGRLPDRNDASFAQVQLDPLEIRGRVDERIGDATGPDADAGTGRVVEVDYKNWRGERRWRRILPHSAFRFGHTEYHDGDQWLFQATDLEDGVLKEFAMSGVRGWRMAHDQTLPWRRAASDSVMVRLSEGSYEMSAEAIKRYGHEALKKAWDASLYPDVYPDECHPSHTTRPSDASSFDLVCTRCGARDSAGGGWGSLRYPCKPKTG